MATGNSRRFITTLGIALLSACAGPPPAPAPEPVDERGVEERVRAPAREEAEGVQVFPLQNPAVRDLLAQAEAAEVRGDYEVASAALERALRIQPRDPELLQRMAEVQLGRKDYQQALNFAQRSYDTGPRVGEICSRNWRTIGMARDHLGDSAGSVQAEQRAGDCMNTKPPGY